ncbi:uncharacterized protein LOC119603426 isoform X2 [Lucilia sericata]|uniref:uncharacterized protein LOC119603426 isoform X2 n=1 Tax=Lucilia sericata TaxID=13632 RepID=UPI0018A862C6|nr:uncharacterized protein LOC119603426 isoform X2 [Lucilia sericata]
MRTCSLCKKKKPLKSCAFFGIPKDERRRKLWNEACRLDLSTSARICENHFLSTDIVIGSKKPYLLPSAVPAIQTKLTGMALTYTTCALGCPNDKDLYRFPTRRNDEERRKLWLDFFEMEEPNLEDLFACERHFSNLQSNEKGILLTAVPDVSVRHNTLKSPLTSKPNKSRKNLTLTKSPEDITFKNQQGVLTQNVYNINNNVQEPALYQDNPVVEIYLNKPKTKVAATQTQTRLCATVQASEFADEYRFNCFYCCKTFPLSYWKKFVNHLKKKHFEYEKAFEISKYVTQDHDYTALASPTPSLVDIDNNIIKTQKEDTLVIEASSLLPYLVESLETSNKSLECDILSSNFCLETEEENAENLNDLIKVPSSEKNKTIKKGNIKQRNIKFFLGKSKQKQTTKTALSRCLKRSNTIETIMPEENEYLTCEEECEEPSTNKRFQQESTELSFEFTPSDIINSLLENMKNYPVLWEFDEQQFNEDYYEAIEELCRRINEKWSLNIDTLRMRRSINRVLRFYCSVYPCENVENVNQFTNYYDKLNSFLPSPVQNIAYARCSHCYKCFKNISELSRHLLEEYKYLQWPYKCVQCKECFRDINEYEFHKRLPHYEEVFRCENCNKRFTQRNKYNKHVASHQTKESSITEKHKCEVCGKVFKLNSLLRNHMVFHGERKHKCNLCLKSYYTSATLRHHIRTHSKDYRLMCDICGKEFLHYNNLKVHMTKHTGDKVTCNICNLKLRKSSLLRHLRTVHVACEGTIETTYRAKNHHYRSLLQWPNKRYNHHRKYNKEKNYYCQICNIRFERYKFLLEHNKETHADAPKWTCKICNSEFRQKISIKRHYRVKHQLHVYQAFKLVDQDEDLETVLAIREDELEKLMETLSYSLNTSGNVKKLTQAIEETKDLTAKEMYTDEKDETLHSDLNQEQILLVTDDVNTETNEIKIVDVDDHYMNEFLTNLLK